MNLKKKAAFVVASNDRRETTPIKFRSSLRRLYFEIKGSGSKLSDLKDLRQYLSNLSKTGKSLENVRRRGGALGDPRINDISVLSDVFGRLLKGEIARKAVRDLKASNAATDVRFLISQIELCPDGSMEKKADFYTSVIHSLFNNVISNPTPLPDDEMEKLRKRILNALKEKSRKSNQPKLSEAARRRISTYIDEMMESDPRLLKRFLELPKVRKAKSKARRQ